MKKLVIKNVKNDVYADETSDFGIVAKCVATLTKCRDRFHLLSSTSTKGMIFRGPLRKTSKFIKQAEDRLGLPSSQRAVFGETTLSSWIAFQPRWWYKDYMRFTLFTLLLRAGRTYKSLDTAIEQYDPLVQTQVAVKLFFEGNTFCCEDVPRGNYSAWVARLAHARKASLAMVNEREFKRSTHASPTGKLARIIEIAEIFKGSPKALQYYISKELENSHDSSNRVGVAATVAT